MKPAAYPRPIPKPDLEVKLLYIESKLKSNQNVRMSINKHPRDYTIWDVLLFLRENGRPYNQKAFDKMRVLWFELNYPIRRQPEVLEAMHHEVSKREEYIAIRDSKKK